MPHSPEIGFVGLGHMGGPMSARLAQHGFDVVGFDLAADGRDRLVASGGRAVEDVRALAASSDIVILMLPNSDVVEAVTRQLVPGMRTGTAIVDMGSSEPTRTKQLGEWLNAQGIRFVDAPVSGGVRGAVDGTLTIMVGGDPAAVPGLEDILATLGNPSPAGPVGSGHAVKALNNLLSAAHFWMTSEAVAVGIKLGIDPEVLLGIVNRSSGRSGSSEAKWPNFVIPETFDSGFEAQLMLKDVKIAVKLADDVHLPTPLGRELAELWQESLAELPPHADHTEIAKVLLRRAMAAADREEVEATS